MKFVVTGASGHLGVNVVRARVAAGESVRAVGLRPDAALAGLPAEFLRADVLDASALKDAFTGAECVLHLAARISIAGDLDGSVRRVNVEGVRNVVQRHWGSGSDDWCTAVPSTPGCRPGPRSGDPEPVRDDRPSTPSRRAWAGRLLLTPESRHPPAAEPVIDCSKAIAELGYRPRPLAETVAEPMRHSWRKAVCDPDLERASLSSAADRMPTLSVGRHGGAHKEPVGAWRRGDGSSGARAGGISRRRLS